ncbi:MAG: hypothetical protein OEY94_05505 [Alphaproteobacteria bacterium]|nr:hypothetical protein [Alphaproteobacteria bacterium]
MKFSEIDHPDKVIGPDGEEYQYVYYSYADIPVRVLADDTGYLKYSEVMDYKIKDFDMTNYHVGSIPYDSAGDAVLVTKEEFYKLCDDYLAYWTPEEIERAERNAIAMRRAVEEEEKNG